MKVSRNARCPCGSGKKYKQCHGRGHKAEQNPWATARLVFLALLILAGLVLAVASFLPSGGDGAASRAAASTPGASTR